MVTNLAWDSVICSSKAQIILKPSKQKFTSVLLTAQKHNHSEEFLSARHKIHVAMEIKHEYLAKSLNVWLNSSFLNTFMKTVRCTQYSNVTVTVCYLFNLIFQAVYANNFILTKSDFKKWSYDYFFKFWKTYCHKWSQLSNDKVQSACSHKCGKFLQRLYDSKEFLVLKTSDYLFMDYLTQQITCLLTYLLHGAESFLRS